MKIGITEFSLGSRTYIMGILNVTPDSFSDGGRFDSLQAAVDRALEMERQGADIIDVGGESTRPGHRPVDAVEEIRRTAPVISELSSRLRVPVSIDTSKHSVAEAAVEAGATLINDVWGGRRDRNLLKLAGDTGLAVCLMHNQEGTDYGNLMDEILRQLDDSVERALKCGVDPKKVILDPGIGFGKTVEQNLEVMRSLDRMGETGYPWLLGTSRKSMIGKTLNLPAEERVEGTIATNVLGIAAGVDFIRVHDVRENTRAARLTDRIVRTPRTGKNRAYIAFGSNIGRRVEYLRRAAAALNDIEDTVITGLSKIYETDPVGYVDQERFLNAVGVVETGLGAGNLLDELQRIESNLKRERTKNWGPRTIDLDILFFNEEILSTDRLTVPHPELHQRLFVLKPLCDLASLFVHPVLNRRIFELLEAKEGENRRNQKVEYYSDFKMS